MVKSSEKTEVKNKFEFLGINPPEKTCNDEYCPWHGKITVRGRFFKGIVVSDKMEKTVTVVIERFVKVPKYERYMKKRTKIHAHNPPCINAKEGDLVLVGETRKISKTKSFVVLAILKKKEK